MSKCARKERSRGSLIRGAFSRKLICKTRDRPWRRRRLAVLSWTARLSPKCRRMWISKSRRSSSARARVGMSRPFEVRMQILANSASVITPCWTFVMAICNMQTGRRRFPFAAANRSQSRAARRSPNDVESAHVEAQRGGYPDGAVLLLIILDDRDHGAGQREAGAIERVHELWLSALFPIPGIYAACLEVAEVRTGRHLKVAVVTRHVGLEVVLLPLGKPHVAGAHQEHPIGDFEQLQHRLGVFDQRLELVHRCRRLDEFHQL